MSGFIKLIRSRNCWGFALAILIASLGLTGCSGDGGAEETGPDTVAPSTPANLTATAVSPSQINLIWSASTDNVLVTGYKIFRDGVLLVTVGTGKAYLDNGLAPNTLYSYTVQAFDGAGNESFESPSASATTLTPDTTPPTVPTGLSATALSVPQINLSWTASSDNVAVTGYRIFRGGTLLITLGNVTTYQDTGLASSTLYTYNVEAIDAASNVSGQSSSASATTPAPANPVLEWDAVTDPNLSFYRVYYGTAHGIYQQAFGSGINVGNVTTYTVTGLSSGTTYYYAVTAVDTSNVESTYSNEISAVFP